MSAYAAHWALLSGQVAGTVNMVDTSSQFSNCYRHFCREYVAHSPHPAESRQTGDCVSSLMREANVHASDRDGGCQHDYQLETVGGVYLTGAYVCRLCSFRIGMSHDQFHQHADYPRHFRTAANL